MRLKTCFRLREVAGEYMLVPSGEGAVDFNAVFSLSESAAWLWKTLQGREFDEMSAVELLMSEYEVEYGPATDDVRSILEKWKEFGLIDG